MVISAFEHPWLSGLVGDDEFAALLGPETELSAMLEFEAALAAAEAEHGVIPHEAAIAIAAARRRFTPDMDSLRTGTSRDGVAVPELVRQLRQALGEPHQLHLHFGATSQDVIDTALMLRLKAVLRLLDQRLAAIGTGFDSLSARFGSDRLMGRTRMQAAMPIAVGDRIASWREPLARHRTRLEKWRSAGLAAQFGGPVGTLEKLGDKAPAIRKELAARLALADVAQWHSQRDGIAELAGLLSLITGSLGKFGQDVALMAQAGDEIELAAGGGSSAMAHKHNPVGAEILVALARFNATQIAGIHHGLVHEQERSGAAWTLEWLILPQMIMATGAATRIASELIAKVERLGSRR